MDETSYQQFLHSYKSVIVHVIEHGYSQDFEEGEYHEEIKSLWQVQSISSMPTLKRLFKTLRASYRL